MVNRTGSLTVGGAISGSGTLTQQGPGTLILTGNSSYSGLTTISAGTLQIGAGGTAGTLGPNNVVDNGSLVFNRAGSLTIGGTISGSGTLSQQGPGTLILTGNNTYGGSTTIGGGVLQIGNGDGNGTLGSGSVTDNATLAFDRSDNVTLSNAISGSGGLSQEGGGTLILPGANTFSGVTRIGSGVLVLENGLALQQSTLDLDAADAGSLDFGMLSSAVLGGLSGSRSLVLQNDDADPVALSVGGNNGNTVYGGVLSGSAGLTKVGTGTLALTGANAYTGGTTIDAGTLSFASGALAGTGTITFGGGALQWYGVNSDDVSGQIAPIAAGMTAILDTNGNDVTLATGLTGAGELTKVGDGTLALTGANAYTGGTVIDAGTLSFASGALAGTGTITFGGGALQWYGVNSDDVSSQIAPVAAGVAAILDTNGNDVTLATGLTGAGGLTKLGGGTLILTAANTYSGLTTISTGALQVGAGGTSGTLSADDVLDDATLVFDHSDTLTVSNVISGSGGLVQQGPGNLIVLGTNSFSGPTRIAAGTLSLNNILALQQSTLDMAAADAGTLSFSALLSAVLGGLTGSRNLVLQSGASSPVVVSIGDNNQSTTYSGILSGNGNLTKIGTGTLTLTNANTYTDGTTISGGTLQLGAGTANGAVAADIVDNAALVFANASDQTYSGNISGSGTLTMQGTGTLTLGGTNTYGGDTTVADGVLRMGCVEAIPSGPGTGNVIVDSTLDLGGTNITINGLSGAGTITSSVAVNTILSVGDNDQTSEFSGTIEDGSGTVYLTKIGAGTLTLGGANTYTGETAIGGGTLALGADNALPVGGVVRLGDCDFGPGILDLGGYNQTLTGLYTDVESAVHQVFWDDMTNSSGTVATLTINDSKDYVYAGSFSGNLALEKFGQGTLTLTGDTTSTGGAAVYDGTLELGESYSGNAYTVAGQGNPQITRRGNPFYAQVTIGPMSGDDASLASGSLTASTSPVFVLGDWTAAVRQAVSGTIHLSDSGADYSFPSDNFLVGTVQDLKMAIDGNLDAGSGKFDLYQNPAFPDLYNHPDTQLIVLGSGSDAYGVYWVVTTAQPPWLGASVDTPSVAGKEGQQVTDSGTWQDLNPSPAAEMWASVGHVFRNPDGTWDWFYTPGDNPATQTVTVTLSDNGVVTTTSFNLAVTAAPKTSGIASLTLDPGTPSSVVDLWAAFSDREDADTALTYQVVGNSNPNLVSSAEIDPETGQLTLTYASGVCSSSELTIRATDTAGLSVDASFSVTVDPTIYLYWDANGSGGNVGGSGTWDATGLNWHDGTENGTLVAWPTDNDNTYVAVFGGSTGTVSVSGDISVGGIVFATSGYTINAGTSGDLTIAQGGDSGGTMTVSVDANLADTITCPVSGDGTLTEDQDYSQSVSGTGTLILAGADTCTGVTTVNTGTLEIAATGSIAGDLNVGGNGTVLFNDGTVTGDATIAGGLSVAAATVAHVGGTVYLEDGPAVTFGAGQTLATSGLVIQRSATLDGGTLNLNGGTIAVDPQLGSPVAASGTIENLGGIHTYNYTPQQNLTLDKTGAGTLILSGDNTLAGGITVEDGTLQIGDGSPLSANITNQASVVFANSANFTYSGIISGAGSVTMQGPSQLTISGENVYTGTTIMDGGSLMLNCSFGTGPIDLVQSLTPFGTDDSSCILSNYIYGTGGLEKFGSGTLTLSGNNTYTGDTRIHAGELDIGSAYAIANSTLDMNTSANDSGTFKIITPNGSTAFLGNLIGSRRIDMGNHTVQIGGNNNHANDPGGQTFSGLLASTGPIVVKESKSSSSSSNTWTISGNNAGSGGFTQMYVLSGTVAGGGSCAWGNYSTIHVGQYGAVDKGGYTPYASVSFVAYDNGNYIAPATNGGVSNVLTTPNVNSATGAVSLTIGSLIWNTSGCSCQCPKPTTVPQPPPSTPKPVTQSFTPETLTIDSHAADPDFGNGYGVYISGTARIYSAVDGSKSVVFDGRDTYWFNKTSSGETYSPRFGAQETLTYIPASGGSYDYYTMTSPDGTVYKFYGFDSAASSAHVQGQLLTTTAPSGETTTILYNGNGTIDTVTYSQTVNGTPYQQDVYAYNITGDITSVTQSAANQSSQLVAVSQSQYTYYATGDLYGLPGDLKFATTAVPGGTGWVDTGTTYFRYYTDTSPTGFAHALERVVLPNSYAKLYATYGDPSSLPDSTVANFTCYYFEYDPVTANVTKEITFGESNEYKLTATVRAGSAGDTNYNEWTRETVETLPDGSTNTVYTNFDGQPLLTDVYDPSASSGSQHTVTYYQYDPTTGYLVLTAEPSAIDTTALSAFRARGLRFESGQPRPRRHSQGWRLAPGDGLQQQRLRRVSTVSHVRGRPPRHRVPIGRELYQSPSGVRYERCHPGQLHIYFRNDQRRNRILCQSSNQLQQF